jgi:triacylglycerol esterase/lipase EstA (alpha/beta hydrolase family)
MITDKKTKRRLSIKKKKYNPYSPDNPVMSQHFLLWQIPWSCTHTWDDKHGLCNTSIPRQISYNQSSSNRSYERWHTISWLHLIPSTFLLLKSINWTFAHLCNFVCRTNPHTEPCYCIWGSYCTDRIGCYGLHTEISTLKEWSTIFNMSYRLRVRFSYSFAQQNAHQAYGERSGP